jgi:hypothetical protein
MERKKAAVFVLLGQSNAVGHGAPMKDEDIISAPLKNVFGLSREKNQSFDIDRLSWSGYQSFGMNLAEEQDNTYSVANCLAALWQNQIDDGKNLPDLYILQIAIGAQGITEGYMWHPDREKKLIPGVLGTVDISLYPFTLHILSLLKSSFEEMNMDFEVIGLHWRGGENDALATRERLENTLMGLYKRMLSDFCPLLGNPPVILHKICCPERMLERGNEALSNMHFINGVFEELAAEFEKVEIFDPTEAPWFNPDIRGNGIFMEDVVHFTPEVNRWVAEKVIQNFINKR